MIEARGDVRTEDLREDSIQGDTNQINRPFDEGLRFISYER